MSFFSHYTNIPFNFFSPRPVRVRHVTNLNLNVGSLSHKIGVLVKHKSVENRIVYIIMLLPTYIVRFKLTCSYVKWGASLHNEHLIIVQFVHIITVHIPVLSCQTS